MTNDLAMASGLGDPLVPWIFEIVLPLIWLGIAAFHFNRTRRTGAISLSALLFLGGTTMWWQEWYADWAAYLLFNYNFAQIPWGPTAWTAPSKPWAVIPSYGWYFGIVFALLVMLAGPRKKSPTILEFVACYCCCRYSDLLFMGFGCRRKFRRTGLVQLYKYCWPGADDGAW